MYKFLVGEEVTFDVDTLKGTGDIVNRFKRFTKDKDLTFYIIRIKLAAINPPIPGNLCVVTIEEKNVKKGKERFFSSVKTTKKALHQLLKTASQQGIPTAVHTDGEVDNIYISGKLVGEILRMENAPDIASVVVSTP